MNEHNFRLEVQCPLCLENGSDVKNSLILHGDDEQNMQCLNCGYATNSKYKGSIDGQDFTDDFKAICRKINDRNWVPAIFTTDNYFIIPDVRGGELVWIIRTKLNTESTEIVMPHFRDAYNIIQTMENHSVDEIQQS
jgi:hypothetical protein